MKVLSSSILNPKQTEILRVAVQLAKHVTGNKVATLRKSLLCMWPRQQQDVDAALQVWQKNEDAHNEAVEAVSAAQKLKKPKRLKEKV
jgi:hypothetical protein